MAFPVIDAIGYQLSSLSLDDKPSEAPYALPTNVYRILRPDENPDGIVAKNPDTQKSFLSHVNCGSRPKYASQFISTSASIGVRAGGAGGGGSPPSLENIRAKRQKFGQ